ncbi:MAG: proline dehydrogenase family protein [Deltaproteobacteria bacterium]|nr:proline dehydrogenase family protein [Deltaproteobacteria bacterium]
MKGIILTLFANRYIAGTDKADAVEEARRLNAAGLLATIDNLGENVKSAEEAGNSVREYIGLLDLIAKEKVNSTVSLKLTHLGLDISDGRAFDGVEAVIKKAALCKNFVRFDMEGSAYTERTMEIFLRLRESCDNVGIAVQSALLRSRNDVKLLIEKKASVRLVKGAYKEPAEVAFERKKDVDGNYEFLMKELLLKGERPAIATHDERLIEEAVRFVKEKGIPVASFEFQMLLGIKSTLQKRLASEGYNVRVYIPYGRNWLPYILRRLSERRENIWFVLKNIFD